ncbi:mitotic-spindle organizing protein 2B isoform X2 [Bombina bombina]|uniref:mitotic-spindle organizing protein 2B isoform X2 n=1 Tax=Bombina bombina TaxID=8345 RepID=UPI00235B0023|nr:mitotic-spindle organizing protein 2B isoform X2 [Bombina bombina]
MSAPQGGSGLDSLVTVSGSVQKYVAKKKKVLNAEEAELYELAQAAGIVMDQEVFKVLVDLLKMNVAPLAVFQMLKSMCAGHKLTDSSTGEASAATLTPSHSDSRGRHKLNPSTNTGQGAAERSNREGSSQRVPRQPSASRMQKSSSSGKSSGGSST